MCFWVSSCSAELTFDRTCSQSLTIHSLFYLEQKATPQHKRPGSKGMQASGVQAQIHETISVNLSEDRGARCTSNTSAYAPLCRHVSTHPHRVHLFLSLITVCFIHYHSGCSVVVLWPAMALIRGPRCTYNTLAYMCCRQRSMNSPYRDHTASDTQ